MSLSLRKQDVDCFAVKPGNDGVRKRLPEKR